MFLNFVFLQNIQNFVLSLSEIQDEQQVPPEAEMEEFFSAAEKREQKRFAESKC